jgi:hypothetical protein
VNKFIQEGLLFGDLYHETQSSDIVLIKSDIAFIGDFSLTAIRSFLFVVYSQQQLISRGDEVEMYILFCG